MAWQSLPCAIKQLPEHCMAITACGSMGSKQVAKELRKRHREWQQFGTDDFFHGWDADLQLRALKTHMEVLRDGDE